MRSPIVASLVGAVLFVAGAIAVAVHAIAWRSYGRMGIEISLVLDALYAVLWLASAVVVGLRARRYGLIPVLGGLSAIAHGIGYSVVEPLRGLPFILGGAIAVGATWIALRMTHGPGEIPPVRAGAPA